MKTNPRIDQEVEQTLRSIDGIERVGPKPFFHTRVEARLARHREADGGEMWAFRPAYLITALGLTLLLNLSVAFYATTLVEQDEQALETNELSTEWGFDSNDLDW